MMSKVAIGVKSTDGVNEAEAFLNSTMDLVHSEIKDITVLLNTHRLKNYDRDTYIGLKALIDDKLELNTRVYVLMSSIVLAKAEIDMKLREKPNYALNSRFVANLKELSEYLGAYKSISYSVGSEIQVLKEFIYVKHPELRQRFDR